MERVDPRLTEGDVSPPGVEEAEGEGWTITDGRVSSAGRPSRAISPEGVEPLTYNNPFGQGLERVWYKGRIVFALDVGEVEVPSAEGLKVAREYQPVYSVELDEQGKLKGEPETVPGQYNIYASVPGDEDYSPIWQFYYVVVPRDYGPNTLRSAEDCERSGYPIYESNVFEN